MYYFGKSPVLGLLIFLTGIVLRATVVDAWTFWQAPPTSASCTSDVPFADTQNCTCYYQCFRVNGLWMLLHLNCPTGGLWDDMYKSCVEGTCGATTTTAAPASTTKPPTTRTPAPTSKPPVRTTRRPVVTTTKRTTTTSTAGPPRPPPSGNPCPYEGYFADPLKCQAYYKCVSIRGRMYKYNFLCPFGSYWKGSCYIGKCPAGK